jgi:outer membrane lipoprotein-sorting protein
MRQGIKFVLAALLGLLARPGQAADDRTANPAFSPPGGVYNSSQNVKITVATPGAIIYFTTNGETPTTSSAKYSGAIRVSESENLKATAVANGTSEGGVTSATYDLLASVLHQLDVAAANFHTTSADFEFDTVTTDPIYDKDVQTGIVYYQRKGSSFQMAAHINGENGKSLPDGKVYTVSGGIFKLYEKLIDQVTTSNKVSKYESYLMLGFGASGKDLADKWNITDLGSETVAGVKTEKLELVAKDPQILKLFPKVTVWIDPARGVSLKQVFDEGQGQSRTCTYSNIKVNQSFPADAFTLKTDSQTQFVNR